MPTEYDDDLRLAHVIADSVDSMTLDRFKSMDFTVETKPDLTPVTEVDRDAEESVRSALKRYRSRDAFLGEEGGLTGHGPRKWVIDPIDGTKNFVRGIPVWATLMALMDGDEVVVGLVSAPALQKRWWAAKGAGAWTGRSLSAASRCQVSSVSQMKDASLSYSSLGGWESRGKFDEFIGLTQDVWRSRAYGDFWSYMLLAEGGVDIACEPELNFWDIAALVPIVTEAGGTFTGVDGGNPLTELNAIATNGHLHEDVVRRLCS